MDMEQPNDKVNREVRGAFEISALLNPLTKVHRVLTVDVVSQDDTRSLEGLRILQGLTKRVVDIQLPE